jgi:hypothetical protein
MKKFYVCFTVALVFLAWTSILSAQTKEAVEAATAKPGGELVEVLTGVLTVDSIDAAKRAVTLKSPDGNLKSYKLGPEVKNFDQIKVGDEVKVALAESVAIFVRKSDEPPAAVEMETVQAAPKGEKPAVVVTDTFEMTAKVEAIDYEKRTVTLKGPEGNVKTFSVGQRVKNFNNVKIGDEVVLRLTEALAIAVEKP